MKDWMKLTCLGLAVIAIVAAVIWGLSSTAGSIVHFTQAIADPTERGLSYVAVAIVVHAFLGSSRKVEVEVKSKDSSQVSVR